MRLSCSLRSGTRFFPAKALDPSTVEEGQSIPLGGSAEQ